MPRGKKFDSQVDPSSKFSSVAAIRALPRADLRNSFLAEFARIYGECDSYTDRWGSTWVKASGWPQYYCYDLRAATEVLAKHPTAAGRSEQGDADVCEALEQEGALIEAEDELPPHCSALFPEPVAIDLAQTLNKHSPEWQYFAATDDGELYWIEVRDKNRKALGEL